MTTAQASQAGLLTFSMEVAVEKFVREQNLSRFRDLLHRVTDEGQRKQIEYLIAQEEAKDPALKSKPLG
jgi:hypothetical protein